MYPETFYAKYRTERIDLPEDKWYKDQHHNTVRVKHIDKLILDEMGDYPIEAVMYFEKQASVGLSLAGSYWTKPLDRVINEYLNKNNITEKRLIDIKYLGFGTTDGDSSYSALIIYE